MIFPVYFIWSSGSVTAAAIRQNVTSLDDGTRFPLLFTLSEPTYPSTHLGLMGSLPQIERALKSFPHSLTHAHAHNYVHVNITCKTANFCISSKDPNIYIYLWF